MTYNAIAEAALQHSIALRVHTSVGGSFPEALTAVREAFRAYIGQDVGDTKTVLDTAEEVYRKASDRVMLARFHANPNVFALAISDPCPCCEGRCDVTWCRCYIKVSPTVITDIPLEGADRPEADQPDDEPGSGLT